MSMTVATILGAVTAVAGAVLALIFITPAKKRESLPKFFQIVHDIFNFKFLLVEKLIRFLYIVSTLYCLSSGFFMLFAGYESYFGDFESYALQGFVTMLLGPIAVRVVYELLMMAILAVKNIIEINGKLKNQNDGTAKSDLFEQPEYLSVGKTEE